MEALRKKAPGQTGAGVHPAYSKYAPLTKHIVAEMSPFSNKKGAILWESEE